VRESKTKWVAIFSQLSNRQELSNKIRITDVAMQDQRIMHLDEFTESSIRVFTTEQLSVRPYEYFDMVHLSISYEMDLNKQSISRSVYTALDWLGSVGGLMGILFMLGGHFLYLISGNGLTYLLLSSLFKEQSDDIEMAKYKKSGSLRTHSSDYKLQTVSDRIPLSKGFRVYACDKLCHTCCMKRVYRKRMSKGEARFGSELDVVNFIRRQRRQFFTIKAIMTKMERYLVHNDKFFVLGGNNSESTPESDVPQDWRASYPWNDQQSQYFDKLLESTVMKKRELKDKTTEGADLEKKILEDESRLN